MKTRIELSCVEEDLITSIQEVKQIMGSLNITRMELRVFPDRLRVEPHAWIVVTNTSNEFDTHKIYHLEKEVAALKKKLDTHNTEDNGK